MAKFDTRPKTVDIDHYAGDTLTVRVNVAEDLVDGREWHAQVRDKRRGGKVVADFTCTPDVDGAFITLPSADCQVLAAGGPFRGFWDVQVSYPDGPDPVLTFATGYLNIHPDVTQLP
jgi:hypothetical protein